MRNIQSAKNYLVNENLKVSSASASVGSIGGSSSHHKENKLWDALTTHHMLPVFAAAKAFVPTSFESLLVQVLFFIL